jgi:hypothetical protein
MGCDPLGRGACREIGVVELEVLWEGEVAVRVEDVPEVIGQEAFSGTRDISLRGLREKTLRGFVARQASLDVGEELDEHRAETVFIEQGLRVFDELSIARLVKCPDVGEDEPRQVAPGHLFEDPTPKFGNEPVEGLGAEWKDRQDDLDREVVMEEREPGQEAQLPANRHLPHSRGTYDEHYRPLKLFRHLL